MDKDTVFFVELTPNNRAVIGSNLRKQRNCVDLTGQEAADLTEIPVSTLYRLENGLLPRFIAMESVVKLAKVIHCVAILDLFRGCTGGPNRPKPSMTTIISTKEYSDCFNNYIEETEDLTTSSTTNTPLEIPIDPELSSTVADLADIKLSLKRVELSLLFIVRSIQANNTGGDRPSGPEDHEEQF